MSTDFTIVCDRCRMKIHAGQFMAGGKPSFGYGPNDVEGRDRVAEFAFTHAYHCDGGVRIVLGDTEERRPCDEYARPAWDE